MSRSRADILTETRLCCLVHSTVLVNCKNSFSLFGAPELEFQNENHILSSLFQQKISSSFLLKLSQCCKGVKISQALAHALNSVFCVWLFWWVPCALCGLWLSRGGPTVLSHCAECGCPPAYNSFRSFCARCLFSKWVNHRCNFLQNYQLLQNIYGSLRGLLLYSHCAAAFLKAN